MTSLFDHLPADKANPEGEARRDAALGLLRVHRAALVRKLTAAAVRFALAGGQVCADDVRDAEPLPDGANPKCVGAVFAGLATAGILRPVDYRKTRRPVAHARKLTIWGLANRAAAVAHLSELEKLIAADASTLEAEGAR